jgi:biopolymer transport protein ExbD
MRSVLPPSESSDVIDVDVTPVMNMFIILIPFLISVAVFTQLSILEFSLPPNVGTGLDDSSGKPRLKLTVVVAPEYLAITYGENRLDSIPLINDSYDLSLLSSRLSARRDSVEINNEIIVAVRDKVRFENVVAVMDRCRDAGFEKAGLSSATEDVRGGL